MFQLSTECFPACKKYSQQAFTLVEMAVVTAIVAVLVGGMITSVELLRQAELRKITSGLTSYETAFINFRDKYNALPGDMRNATSKWGVLAGDGANEICQNTKGNALPTCNGNGDGVIGTSVSTVPQDETNRAWQHMKNAGFISGKFVGTTNGVTLANLLKDTLPQAGSLGIGYQFRNDTKQTLGWTASPEGITFPIRAFRVAGPITGTPIQLGSAAISPLSMRIIEQKIDDGRPGTGKVFAAITGTTSCVAGGTNAASATYATNEAKGCFFHYHLNR